MKRAKLIVALCAAPFTVLLSGSRPAAAPQTPAQVPPVATFKAGIDLVRISAVVRNRKGRFVDDLSVRDFEVLESGRPRRIADFRRDVAGVSVALLFDVSGSMDVSSKIVHAREAAAHVLSSLDPGRDEAAVFAFDTALTEIAPFTAGLRALPESLDALMPFGATSLHDAIAQTAGRTVSREAWRRAVVVLTDGSDNASRLSAPQVSGIASAIDVPVYIIGIVSSIDNPSADVALATVERSTLAGSLTDMAAWTGGHVFIASTPMQRSVAARQIVDELRHQYLIAFESSDIPGWHPLVVRARGKGLVVRARSGYVANHGERDIRRIEACERF